MNTKLDLQWFAEGGGGDGGAAGEGTASAAQSTTDSAQSDVQGKATEAPKEPKLSRAEQRRAKALGEKPKKATLAAVKYGKNNAKAADAAPVPETGAEIAAQTSDGAKVADAAKDTATDTQAEFLKLVGKDGIYAAPFADALKAALEKQAPAPASEEQTRVNTLLSEKYGVDSGDTAALLRAMETEAAQQADREAFENGLTREQQDALRQSKQAQAKAQQAERVRQITEQWNKETVTAKEAYPDFDFDVERKNPDFADLLKRGVSVKSAYEVVHMQDLLQNRAKAAEQSVLSRVTQRANRPTENGAQPQGAVLVKTDVKSLSKADMEEIERRVMRGEKIEF